MSTEAPTMSGILTSKKFEEPKKPKKPPAPKLADVEVTAYIPFDAGETNEERRKQLREEEKSLMARRKQTKDILTKWDPNLIATKARESFERDVKEHDKRLREIRKKLGK